MANEKKYRIALTIAGSDSGGGAGIQADLKTFAALGCFGASVITAVTAQNTTGVQGVSAVPADFIEKQLESVLSDIRVDAAKTGMLYDCAAINAVSRKLQAFNVSNLVVDPVMVAKGGHKLLQEDAIESLIMKILPFAALVTPNIPEAELLAKQQIKNKSDMESAAKKILALGPASVLIKGGHLESNEANDLFFSQTDFFWHEAPKIETVNTHGTGCTLSAAITAYLALGAQLSVAISNAKKFITGAITAGSKYKLGSGHGPLNHFYKYFD